MAIFDIYADSTNIFTGGQQMTLIDPVLTQNVSAASTLNFTMSHNHVFHDTLTPYGTTIRVIEDGATRFYGRVASVKRDAYNNLTVHCEDCLAWLNDVPLRASSQPLHSDPIDSATYCQEIIDYYNQQVGSTYPSTAYTRQITVAALPDTGVGLKTGREWKDKTVFEALAEECKDVLTNGIMFFRGKSIRIVELASYMSGLTALSQRIEAGKNLMDISINSRELYTSVYAVGDGVTLIKPAGATHLAKYGYICKKVEFKNATSSSMLNVLATAWIANQPLADGAYDIDAKAIDLHYTDQTQETFDVARKVILDGSPWGIGQVTMPISQVVTHLDTGQREITLSTSIKPKRQITLPWQEYVRRPS